MSVPPLPTDAPLLPEPRWHWEQPDPSRSGSAGDLSKLFRNVNVKKPGVMEIDAPPDDATVLAREAIQNSWDAAIELRETWTRPETLSPFEILFRYGSASRDDKRRLIERLGLREMAERASSVDRGRIGLRASDCLDRLEDTSPLPYLVIEERAATGMYGPWQAAKSKLYLALGTLGYTPKTSGEGGSYGYGKAGLIRGSAVRAVLAYTCFEERPDDPGITRRLMGMAYWGQHDLHGDSFTGFARFGDRKSDGRVPFENEVADSVARSLGLAVRHPGEPELLGTTFLLVEPTVEEHALVAAIERNWWPALEEDDFDAVVDGYDGRRHPRPRTDPVLGTFINAYELATTPQDNNGLTERRHELRSGGRRLGSLGLVADPDPGGWSYPEQTGSSLEQGIEHCNLVALVRKPRMVVEYLPHPPKRNSGSPYVRGVFVADDGINEHLQDTEPMGHDAWQTTSPDGVLGQEQANVAAAVIEAVRKQVTDFRRSLKPPDRPAEDIRLDFFDSLMRRVLRGSGSGRPGPTPETRPVSVALDYEPQEADEGSLRLAGAATFRLSEHFEGDATPARVTIRYRLVEDDTARDAVALVVDPAPGFVDVDGGCTHFEGVLTRRAATFRFASEPYRADWTGKLFAEGEPLKPVTS